MKLGLIMQSRSGYDSTSVALLDGAFRNAPMVFNIAEPGVGRPFTYMSPNIEKLLGYSPESFLSFPAFWREHLHPEDAGRVLDILERIAETGHQILEYRFLDAMGAYRWLRDEVTLIHPDDGEPPYLQGYWHDIGEQKMREASLQQKADSLQLILDSLPQRLVWKDQDSVFRGCNLAAAREIGLARTDDIVGRSDFDFHADAMDAEYLRQIDEAVMAAGQATYHADLPAKQPGVWLDVTKVPLRDADGQVNGLLIGYEDVSELRRDRFDLINFRRAVEQSSNVIVITDLKGDIEYVNPRFVELFGYTDAEVVGKNPRLLKDCGLEPSAYRELWQTLRGGKSWRGEFSNRAKDGKSYWLSAIISPIFDDNGSVAHFLAIEEDITTRRQLATDLKRQLDFTQTLINALPHPVYFKDIDGIYRGCNLAFEKTLGLPKGGLVGKTVFDIAPPDVARQYRKMDNELFAHPGIQAYESKLLHADGTLHDILSHKATFTDEQGNVAGIIGSVFDITDRKVLEEQLRQSELRFRTIANNTYNWENWVSPEGKLLWINPAVERITGYSMAECYAMPDFPIRLIYPEDAPIVGQHYAESLAGAGHRPLECRIVRKDGETRWIEVFIEQVYDAHGNNIGHRSSISDVTERRRAMDDLHRTRNLLKLVLDHIPQGVFWKGMDGNYLGGNIVFSKVAGLNRSSEISGCSDFDFFPAAEAEKFRRDDRKVMDENRQMSSIEEQVTDSDGTKHYLMTTKVPLRNEKGEVFGVLGTFADLTELRQIDAELRDSEARLREITTTAAEGILVMDPEGIVTFVNPEVERLLERDASELIGQTERLFYYSEREADTGKAPHRIFVTTLAEKSFYSEDEQFLRKDGSRFNVSVRATPIMRDKKYNGAVVAFHDITEQKLNQRLLQDTLKELQSVNATLEMKVDEQTKQNIEKERLLIQQSRSAAMGEMISNIAHQWRQPLSTLGLVVQNILLDYRDNELNEESLEKYVETAQQCVMRMSDTIDDFRDFFRPDKAKVFFSLHQAVSESLRLLEATLKNNDIQVMLGEDQGVQAFGHVSEFSQVILNILANAKDALLSKKNQRQIEIELASTGHSALVVIRDNAGGIPENAMDKIFDPYFTTKVSGTGIGLYMSKTIIEKHLGGDIVCRNTADGAEFTISIPLGTDAKTGAE